MSGLVGSRRDWRGFAVGNVISRHSEECEQKLGVIVGCTLRNDGRKHS